MPCCAQATPITPSKRPLKNMDQMEKSPNTMPPAKAIKQTERLFVMMALLASGSTPTIDSVHILWCSMVSTICGPSMWRMNSGRASVSTVPSVPPASRITSDSST